MKLPSLCLWLLVFTSGFHCMRGSTNEEQSGLLLTIVGVDTNELNHFLRVLDSECVNVNKIHKNSLLHYKGVPRLLNIIRQDDGKVRFVEFAKGDLLIVWYPDNTRGFAVANLEMGFAYKIEIEGLGKKYEVIHSGVETEPRGRFEIQHE